MYVQGYYKSGSENGFQQKCVLLASYITTSCHSDKYSIMNHLLSVTGVNLVFDLPFLVHIALIMKDDNHQNCPVNDLSASPCDIMLTRLTSIVISQYERKIDWNQKTNYFF